MDKSIVIIVFALSLLAGILVLFGLGSQSPSVSTGGVAEVLAQDQVIVYHCHDGDFEICMIRTDGTGFRTVTNNDTDDFRPAINRLGQIAYFCSGTSGAPGAAANPQICVINFDGSGFRQLTNNAASIVSSSFEEIVINDAGEVFYPCTVGIKIEICMTESRNRRQHILTDNTWVESNLTINASGQLAFLCFPENTDFDAATDICSMNRDGSGFTTYMNRSSQENAPVINDEGLIVSHCEDATSRSQGFCIYQIGERGNTRVVVEELAADSGIAGVGIVGPRYSLNNSGQIAFQCRSISEGADNEICIINADGSDFMQLTFNEVNDEWPAINDDGTIAFLCGRRQLCVIDSEGSDVERVTRPGVLSPSAFALLKMN